MSPASADTRARRAALVAVALASAAAAAPSPLANGLLGDLFNSNFAPNLAGVQRAPVAPAWWPAVGASPPYAASPGGGQGAVLTTNDTVISLTPTGDAVQALALGAAGAVAARATARFDAYTTFGWLPRPLPPLLSPAPVGGRAALTLYVAFVGRVRNASPPRSANVVLALDAGDLSLVWKWEHELADANDAAAALLLSTDGAALVLATVNTQTPTVTANLTSLDPATGAASAPVPLPSALAGCGGQGPYVGRSLLLPSPPTLVVTFGSGNGRPSFGDSCVYAADVATGAVPWALPVTATWAPISTGAFPAAAPPPPGVDILLFTTTGGLGLSRAGAVAWNVSFPGSESLVFGAALAPLAYPGGARPGQPTAAAFAAAAWGRSYPVVNVYAFEPATGAVLASTAVVGYPDGADGGGALLAAPADQPFPDGASLFVRSTPSLASSAYAAFGDGADVAFASVLRKLGFACGTDAASCAFSETGYVDGGRYGVAAGGSLVAGPPGAPLLLVTGTGVQAFV